ncbi:MAG TPA: rhomboid family intramembrane serine protease [Mycobacteriales bacterium]|nr:rhomboid family intramembrane serine protease [Mycobacteriales bacterium]
MVIPVHDDNPTHRRPWVTYLLILLNVVVFFQEPIAQSPIPGETPAAQACRQEAFFREYAAIPQEVVTNDPLDTTAGAASPAGGCTEVEPDYDKSPALSVLYAMFLHGGLLHLLGNMLFLWVFGNNVEDRLGRLRYLACYLAWGYVATYVFAFAFRDSTTVLIGASGAVAGVLGAYLKLFPRARVLSLVPFLLFFPFRLPAWLVLGSWFALQYGYSRGAGLTEGSGVAYLAHVAGFVAGFVTLFLLRTTGGQRPGVRRGRLAS